jgi:hypothetical protein
MDATEPDKDKAYGFVTRDLREKRVGLADNELKREINELEQRMKYAKQGLAALALLHEAELAL